MEREVFLASVAARLGRHRRDAGPSAAYELPQRLDLPDKHDALVELFESRLDAVGGEAHRVTTRVEAREKVSEMLATRGAVAVACPPSARWPGLKAIGPGGMCDAAFGLSEALCGIADTGSVVLLHGGEHGRNYSLLPPAVGFLLPTSRVVASLRSAFRLILDAEDCPPVCITLVTGASHSADIGCIPIRGVHGPGEVHVWLIGDE